MFSDQSSFILATVVTLGFSISGMLNILDNFVVITLLMIGFIIVVANLFTYDKHGINNYEKPNKLKKEDFEEFEEFEDF